MAYSTINQFFSTSWISNDIIPSTLKCDSRIINMEGGLQVLTSKARKGVGKVLSPPE
jgi:hypothetical protein